jgi:hypothetical protein
LIIAREPGKLYCCEAFYLDFTAIKGAKWKGKIIEIRYNPREFGVMLALENGEAVLIPWVHDED